MERGALFASQNWHESFQKWFDSSIDNSSIVSETSCSGLICIHEDLASFVYVVSRIGTKQYTVHHIYPLLIKRLREMMSIAMRFQETELLNTLETMIYSKVTPNTSTQSTLVLPPAPGY